MNGRRSKASVWRWQLWLSHLHAAPGSVSLGAVSADSFSLSAELLLQPGVCHSAFLPRVCVSSLPGRLLAAVGSATPVTQLTFTHGTV